MRKLWLIPVALLTLWPPVYTDAQLPTKDDVRPTVTAKKTSEPWTWRVLPEETTALQKTAERYQHAIFLLGNPEVGPVGTAFCISTKHRLLVTCRHNVDPLAKKVQLSAKCLNGVTYHIRSMWCHPDALRTDQKGKLVNADDLTTGTIVTASADVAIIQLKLEGPDLPAEFPLASPGQGAVLQHHALLSYGFSAFAFPHGWPSANESLHASQTCGVAYGLSSLLKTDAGDPDRDWLLWHTAPAWHRNSGAPLFLRDGTVVGIHNGGAISITPDGTCDMRFCGVLVDAVWDLIDRGDDLKTFCDPKRDGRRLSVKPVANRGERQPLPTAIGKRLLEEADVLVFAHDFSAAAKKINAAIQQDPDWGEAYRRRAHVWVGYLNWMFDAGKSVPQEEVKKYERWMYEDALSGMMRAPADPKSHVTLGYGLCCMTSATGQPEYGRAAKTFANLGTMPQVPTKTRATFFGLRA